MSPKAFNVGDVNVSSRTSLFPAVKELRNSMLNFPEIMSLAPLCLCLLGRVLFRDILFA
jgi:hypothetical protein